eukprot:bmy_02951T0
MATVRTGIETLVTSKDGICAQVEKPLFPFRRHCVDRSMERETHLTDLESNLYPLSIIFQIRPSQTTVNILLILLRKHFDLKKKRWASPFNMAFSASVFTLSNKQVYTWVIWSAPGAGQSRSSPPRSRHRPNNQTEKFNKQQAEGLAAAAGPERAGVRWPHLFSFTGGDQRRRAAHQAERAAASPSNSSKDNLTTSVNKAIPETEDLQASGSETAQQPSEEQSKSPEKPKQKKNRRFMCRKKVGLTGFECRCGNVYCGVHHYSDVHKCSYNYKADAAEKIRKENPVVVGEKIQKI